MHASRRPAFSVGRVGLTLLAALAAGPAVLAGGGPENIFLVVNANGRSSMEVANHYVDIRKVPPGNVCYLRTPPQWNAVQAPAFRERILEPILAQIKNRGLEDQIDQIVYSSEFPWFVDFTETFAKTPLSPQQRPRVSLTSATFFYHYVQTSDPQITSLHNNMYFAPPQTPLTMSRAFRGTYRWAAGGRRVESGGAKYLLSTALGFTQAEANTVPEVLAYLKRSAAADGTQPKGTFYYMKNANVRSRVRDPQFPAAVAELHTLGFAAKIEEGVEPRGRKDILGLTTGSPHVRLGAANCRLMPGALVDNLTSAGGQLWPMSKPNMQTRIPEYMRLGAGGASGAVIEPYAIVEKFPSPQLHVHYARGCSMAESFYQSVAGPFQLLIVGDPLCQPYAAIPEVSVEGAADGAFVSGDLELAPSAELPPGRTVARYELFVDGVRNQSRPAGQHFILDTATVGDGYHELRVVAIDSSPIEVQGRWIAGVIVKNGRDALELTASDAARSAGGEVKLNLASTVNRPVAVFHNGREVARAASGKGPVNIAADKLGRGPVVLQARTIGKPLVSSRPLKLEIQ